MVHYLFIYFVFGNPLLIRMSPGSGGAHPSAGIDVELLSANQVADNLGVGGDFKKREYPIFPPEEGNDDVDRIDIHETSQVKSVSGDGMKLIESAGPLPDQPQKKARKLPRNMTGPEDCMLKLVGMVCPDGDFKCIQEYKEFCSALPE